MTVPGVILPTIPLSPAQAPNALRTTNPPLLLRQHRMILARLRTRTPPAPPVVFFLLFQAKVLQEASPQPQHRASPVVTHLAIPLQLQCKAALAVHSVALHQPLRKIAPASPVVHHHYRLQARVASVVPPLLGKVIQEALPQLQTRAIQEVPPRVRPKAPLEVPAPLRLVKAAPEVPPFQCQAQVILQVLLQLQTKAFPVVLLLLAVAVLFRLQAQMDPVSLLHHLVQAITAILHQLQAKAVPVVLLLVLVVFLLGLQAQVAPVALLPLHLAQAILARLHRLQVKAILVAPLQILLLVVVLSPQLLAQTVPVDHPFKDRAVLVVSRRQSVVVLRPQDQAVQVPPQHKAKESPEVLPQHQVKTAPVVPSSRAAFLRLRARASAVPAICPHRVKTSPGPQQLRVEVLRPRVRAKAPTIRIAH